jgi:hypothetical protein
VECRYSRANHLSSLVRLFRNLRVSILFRNGSDSWHF